MTMLDRTDAPTTTEYATVHLVFELSKAKWKLGVMLPGSAKLSRYTIAGGDLRALTARLTDARTKAGRCGKPVRIVSCYEAGFDGHWLHRWLTGVRAHLEIWNREAWRDHVKVMEGSAEDVAERLATQRD